MSRDRYCSFCHLVVAENDPSRVCCGEAVVHRQCVAGGIRDFLQRYDRRLADEFVAAYRHCADDGERAQVVASCLRRFLDRRPRGADLERCWCLVMELAQHAEAVLAGPIMTVI